MLFCKYVMKPINLKIKRKISLMSVSVECTKKEVIRSVSITLLLSSVVSTPPPTTTTTHHPSVIKNIMHHEEATRRRTSTTHHIIPTHSREAAASSRRRSKMCSNQNVYQSHSESMPSHYKECLTRRDDINMTRRV